MDALNPVDPNFSYMLVYANCNHIQTHLPSSKISNKLIIASSFANKSYDCKKVQFVLKCIDELLAKCTKEFLVAITTSCLNTSNGGGSSLTGASNKNMVFSVYNEKLLDLIIRHLKSIFGQNFYNNVSFDLNRINFNLNSTTYIEAIALILLFYVRSYYPPSRFALTTNNKDGDNKTLINMKKSISTASLQSNLSQPSPSNNSSMAIDPPEDLNDEDLFSENRNVQIYALKVFTRLIKELINQSKSMPKFNSSNSSTNSSGGSYLANSLVWYQSISDLLEKTKLQKTLLHCFYSTTLTPAANTLSQCILSHATNKQTQFAYFCELMNALENLIELEKILSDYQLIIKFLKVGSMINNSYNTGPVGSLKQNQGKIKLLLDK